jgi:hypothetical protein
MNSVMAHARQCRELSAAARPLPTHVFSGPMVALPRQEKSRGQGEPPRACACPAAWWAHAFLTVEQQADDFRRAPIIELYRQHSAAEFQTAAGICGPVARFFTGGLAEVAEHLPRPQLYEALSGTPHLFGQTVWLGIHQWSSEPGRRGRGGDAIRSRRSRNREASEPPHGSGGSKASAGERVPVRSSMDRLAEHVARGTPGAPSCCARHWQHITRPNRYRRGWKHGAVITGMRWFVLRPSACRWKGWIPRNCRASGGS